jgi:TonB family protein
MGQPHLKWFPASWILVGSLTASAIYASTVARPSELQTGSGFYVSKEGHILTNHHVIDGCGRVEIELGGIRSKAKLIDSDANNDIALLISDAPPKVTAAFRDGRMIRAGSDVIILGYPLYGALAHEAIVTTGTISALAGMMNNAATFQLSAPTQPGNSGGPVLDAGGTVVGMMFGMLDSFKGAKISGQVPQNVNFAIHGAVIRSFLDAHGIQYVTRPPAAASDRADVVEEARRYTVLIHCFAPEAGPSKEMLERILVSVLDREAPNWRQILRSEEYKRWRKAQPEEYRQTIGTTWDPYTVVASIDSFLRNKYSAKESGRPVLETSPDRSEIDSVLNKLKLPEVSSGKVDAPSPQANADPPKRLSLAEEMDLHFGRALEDLKNARIPPPVKLPDTNREAKPMFLDSKPTKAPVVRNKSGAGLRLPGLTGSNPYLSEVQAHIASFWTAPPVDISGKSLTVIVRFRLERDGRVSSVMIEKPSGNEYYDLSAHRAIQSAIPLPPFPEDFTQSYFDARFTFAVGEAQ